MGDDTKSSSSTTAPETPPFFGRRAELAAMHKALEDPEGKALLVVGPAGMGKSSLVRKFLEEVQAEDYNRFECRAVSYSVVPSDSPELTLSLLLSDAEAATRETSGFLSVTDQGRKQLAALFKLLPSGSAVIDLLSTMRARTERHLRTEFIELLEKLSDQLQENARAIFFLDAERTLPAGSADIWRLITQSLPAKIVLIFAQRPDDALASSYEFLALPNLVRIPSTDLHKLDQAETDEMLDWASRETGLAPDVIAQALTRYDGHPYALAAAVDLIRDGLSVEDLSIDPTPEKIAEAQWNQVKTKHGRDAMRLLKAHAVLEVPVRDEVVRAVGELDTEIHESLLADQFIASILREESGARTVYHAILRDVVIGQMGEQSEKNYHKRAAVVYQEMLKEASRKQRSPDPTACIRAFEHVEVASGRDAAISVFVDECTAHLIALGMLQVIESITADWLKEGAIGSSARAALLGNLGIVLFTRGELAEAEAKFRKSLELNKQQARVDGMAANYGNLGHVLLTRGDLAGAEAKFQKALELNEQQGRVEGVANQYGNLGGVMEIRGDLAGAEKMYHKSLMLNERLGRIEGMAANYSNLGSVLVTRGDLDGAEAKFRKSLELNERLGRVEGMARQYANLGLVMKARGDLREARRFWIESHALFDKLGAVHVVRMIQSWLDKAPE